MKRLALCVIMAASLASAYTYTAWTGMTGAKTFAVNPFFYGTFDDISYTGTDLVVGYGVSDNIDVFANLATLDPIKDGEYGGSWVMPRYALKENHIVCLTIGYDTENLTLAPGYHYFKDMDKTIFEFNASLNLNTANFDTGSVVATAGLVYKLVPDVLYPFVEFNPAYGYGSKKATFDEEGNQIEETSAFDFTIDPGIWFGIKDTPHQFALSIPLSGIKDSDISAGINLWYWWSFSCGSEKAAE